MEEIKRGNSPDYFSGIRKWCVVISMSISALVVLYCQFCHQKIEPGVPEILRGMNGVALVVYGASKTVERVWGNGNFEPRNYDREEGGDDRG